MGDYEKEYIAELKSVLQRRYKKTREKGPKTIFDFDYEPVEALNALLERRNPAQTAVGGAPQLVKVYAHGNTLPFVVRLAPDQHFLLGRRLFSWEKTEYPIIDLSVSPAKLLYPMRRVPVPSALVHEHGEEEKVVSEGLDGLTEA